MKWSPILFVLSFLLIILGVILLFLPVGGLGNGFFFIFPFFFFGSSQPSNIFLLFGIGILLIVVMIFLLPIFSSHIDSTLTQRAEVMAVGAYCEFCRGPIPMNATYCPNCGHEVDHDMHSNNEF